MASEADLRKIFDEWDLDKNGTVRLQEICKYFEEVKGMSHQQAIDQLAGWWGKADTDGDYKMTWDEFKEAMSKC